MHEILVPVFVCVVLPVAIVLIISLTRINSDNKRSQILIKAIEANKDIDTDKLIRSLEKPRKSARDILNTRLLRGCIASLLGIASALYGLYIQCSDPSASLQYLCYLFTAGMLAVGLGYLIVYFLTRNEVENSDNR